MDFLDEFASVAFVALPDVQGEFGVSYALVTLAAFTLPDLFALVVEPPLMLVADRYPGHRKAWVLGGLALMGLCLFGLALAPTLWVFSAVMALFFVANGLGVNLSKATLMDADPDRRELWMTRWVFFGTLGDLAGPLFLALLAWFALGWRSAMFAIGLLVLAWTALLATRTFPALGTEDEDDEEEPGWRETLRGAVANKRLMGWLFAVTLCGLLDEIFVAFGSAWLEQAYGATLGQRGLVLGLGTAGGLVGLVWLEHALARGADPRRWLIGTSVATLAVLVAWVAAPTLWTSAALLVVLEVVAAQLYPLAEAQAYRALPGRAAMVDAIAGLYAPIGLAIPVGVGLVADHLGLVPALLVLGLQPLGLGLVAWWDLRRPGDDAPTRSR